VSPRGGIRMSDNKVVIIDYRLGNLFSVRQACEQVGIEAVVSSDPEEIVAADGLLLPGVGAFGNAMENLYELGLIEPIRAFAAQGGPIFGICLGMQLLFDESEEFGLHQGLGLLRGRVVKFPDQSQGRKRLKVPSIGWGKIEFNPLNPLHDIYANVIDEDEWMYFVHSFYVQPAVATDTLTETVYGDVRFCSSVLRDNIFGTQFHPEKSGVAGLRIYKTWSNTLTARKERVQ